MKKWLDVKRLLAIIIVLNTLDGICTYIGLINHWIEEANPLLSGFSPLVILCIKLLLSGAVFWLWKTTFPTRFVNGWKVILVLVVALYSWITLLHLVWLFLLI